MCKCSVVSGPNERDVCSCSLNGECCVRVCVWCVCVCVQGVEARFTYVVCLNIGYKATYRIVIISLY